QRMRGLRVRLLGLGSRLRRAPWVVLVGIGVVGLGLIVLALLWPGTSRPPANATMSSAKSSTAKSSSAKSSTAGARATKDSQGAARTGAAPAPATSVPPDEVPGLAALEPLVVGPRRNRAIDDLNKLSQKYPKNAYIPYLIGNIYMQNSWWSNGLAAYAEAIK